ncbi:MAG: Uma2 family endonuclease [Deltaproteobacteria bacterium]|nr:Uma2 family endonuclease [Deltaproteobacteria bacterium]
MQGQELLPNGEPYVITPRRYFTPEEYLLLERRSEYKSEHYDGEIFAMSGASEPHNVIAPNIVSSLHTQFRNRSCRVYPSDMRVNVQPGRHYAYPGVVAVCGEPRFQEEYKDRLVNPTVIGEVLSPSTEAYARGDKDLRYRQLASPQEYLLVSQTTPHIEHYVRQPDSQWLLTEASAVTATMSLPSIDCTLALAEVYEKVECEQNLE